MTFDDFKQVLKERDKYLVKTCEYAFDSLYFRYEKAREKQYELEKELAHFKRENEPNHTTALRDERRFYEILSEFLKTKDDKDE